MLGKCQGFEEYGREAFQTLFTREQPQQVRFHVGKQAREAYELCSSTYDGDSLWNTQDMQTLEEKLEQLTVAVAEYTYDFRGNLRSKRDILGNESSYTYGSGGQLVSFTSPDGAVPTFRYDERGRERARINGAGEYEYQLSYDALDRISAKTDGEGNTVTYQYAPCGKVELESSAGDVLRKASYDIWGREDSVTDGNGHTTTYERDSWGRVTKVIFPDGGEETYAYDIVVAVIIGQSGCCIYCNNRAKI